MNPDKDSTSPGLPAWADYAINQWVQRKWYAAYLKRQPHDLEDFYEDETVPEDRQEEA